jgi:hypothetical protein
MADRNPSESRFDNHFDKMNDPQRSTTTTTTTQYSTTSYDENDTVDGSDAESDQDEDSGDGHTIRSFAPPRTPTNSLVSFKVPKISSGEGSRRRGKGREGGDVGYEDGPVTAVGNVSQLEPVTELEETGHPGFKTVGGSSGSSKTDRFAGKNSIFPVPSGFPLRDGDDDDELLDDVQELPMSRGTGMMSEMISSSSDATWTNQDDHKGNKDKDDDVQITHPIDSLNHEHDLEGAQRERDKRILEQLGYSEVLGRDYGFWASFSVGYCVIGGFQGAILSTHLTWLYGGPQ